MRVVAAMTMMFYLLVASCGWSPPSTDAGPTPVPTSGTGGERLDLEKKAAKTPAPTDKAPLFVLRLTDLSGGHPQGIPVRVTGPRNETLFTDANGEVKIFDRPGTYELRIVKGCLDEIDVRDGGWVRVTLPPDESHAEEVQVDWRHRFAPAGPVFMSTVTGNWPIGKQVDMRYPVHDRCRNDAVTPGASYPTYELRPSDAIEVIGTPALVAGDDGYGRVSVRCKASGDVRLFSEDRENRRDSVNLVRGTIEGRRPRCGNF